MASSNFILRDAEGNIVDSYWSPGESMMVEFGALICLAILMVPLLGAASYTVGKSKGLLLFVFILLMPGALNVIGYFPDVNYLPVRYSINGVGKLGSEIGVLPLLLLCAFGGWAIIVLIYDNCGFTDRFRQVYDHFWFPLALVAAFFFVADNGATENRENLTASVAEVNGASGYLLSQVRRYDDYCKANGQGDLKSCKWSQYVQGLLKSMKEEGVGYYIGFAPKTSAEFYGENISTDDVLEIRREISAYNELVCPVKRYSGGMRVVAPISSSCEVPPYGYIVLHPDGPAGLVDSDVCLNSVALASECIIPRLSSFKEHLVKLESLVVQHERSKNYRWLYFLFVAAAVGGKVALSTTKLCGMDNRLSCERSRILKGTKAIMVYVLTLTWHVKKIIGWLVTKLWNSSTEVLRLLVNNWLRR